jgi:nitrate reductase NapE component
MAVYWALFAWPVAALLARQRTSPGLSFALWCATAVVFALLIGLRYQVGGDWLSYERLYMRIAGLGFLDAVTRGGTDPGYAALNWAASRLDGGIYLVNTVCAVVFMAGVSAFSRRQPLPWLALLVTVPYLIVVVAMGYTRQSAALGFVLLALVALRDGRLRAFVALVVVGTLFHKSAVLLLPFAALAVTERRLWTWFWVGAVSALMAALLLLEHRDALWRAYVAAGMVSEGGGIRVGMNAVPALLLLALRQRLTAPGHERHLWCWMAVFTLAMLPLVAVASTAVDRLALYFLPIQAFVYARLPLLFATPVQRTFVVFAIVGGYGLVLWVWLNFAVHAPNWLPYQFGPLR